MHLRQCIWNNAFGTMHLEQCIWDNAFGTMHLDIASNLRTFVAESVKWLQLVSRARERQTERQREPPER